MKVLCSGAALGSVPDALLPAAPLPAASEGLLNAGGLVTGVCELAAADSRVTGLLA